METATGLIIPKQRYNVTTNIPPVMPNINVTAYDNDMTLLYKYVDFFQVPVKLIIVRPRTDADKGIIYGTKDFVFESLPLIVERLSREVDTVADLYDIITGYKESIKAIDVIMTYYSQIRTNNKDPNLYTLINNIYRDIDVNLTVDRFESQDDLQNAYDTWVTELNKQKEADLVLLDTILDIQSRLEEVDKQDKIPFSPVIINSTIMSYSPQIDGRAVTIEDGLDIFNAAVPSRYVPYIRYNDKHGRSLSRVYTGSKIENEPNYSIIIIPSSDASAKNTIYMTLWLGDPNNDGSVELNTAPRESFFTVVYHLESNYLTIESPVGADYKKGLIRDEVLAFERTSSSLPILDFNQGKEIKVRGEFNIWGMSFDETPFLDMILLEPLMNVYLYVEENIKPFALKKRLDVHYRSIFTDMGEGKASADQAYIANSASVSITLSQRTALADEVIDIYDQATKTISQATLPEGSPYVHVNISQAESRNTVNDFIPIFILLMRYYLDNQEPISEVYNAILPELTTLPALLSQRKRQVEVVEPTILELTKKTTVNKRKAAKIKLLQEQAPELFVLNYARRCQCPLQPIIIQPDEVQAWKQKRIGPDLKERQVMSFPKDKPKWLFVCPDDANPYPGVKINKDLINKDEFPYIPCCSKTDQMTVGSNSNYRDYIENKPMKKRIGAKADKKISTRKILVPGKVAFLPRAVENIVKRYSEQFIDMVRYGIIYTPNSLLHCVCNAIDDPNYMDLDSDLLKEEYVTRIRRYMLTVINPALVKQELYDYSDEEIIGYLSDNSRFLDPALFFRAVEEIFNINIYVFSPPPPSGDETELGLIDIPRFKIFHARPLRLDRPTVVIIKTWGSESDNLEYPQCELVVDLDKDNFQIMKLFGAEMTEVCHNTLEESLKTMTWIVKPDNSFEIHSNIYYQIDHLNLFQLPAVSQFIDNNGKMRGLTLNVGNNQLMTISIIPSQPENLPITKEINRISAEVATYMLGDPSGVTRDNNNRVNGLWYKIMDIEYGEYVPIIPFEGFEGYPIGPANPLISTGEAITSRLTRLKRTLNIIVQLIRWLYDIARSNQDLTPDEFAVKFLVMDTTPIEDSSNYYDLSRMTRRFPIVETVEQAIDSLEPLVPTLFNQGKIVMYSPIFAERIIKMLRDYELLYPTLGPMSYETRKRIDKLCAANNKQSTSELYLLASQLKVTTTSGLTTPQICELIRNRYKQSLDNFYETEADFLQVPNSKIFISEKELSSWISSLKSYQNYSRYFSIRKKIDVAMGFSTDPYLYKDDDGKIYIIQNVVGGSKAKALAVSQTWYNYHVNIGSEAASLDIVPIHMIYGISPSSSLVPIEDNTNGEDTFLKIVYYGTQLDKQTGKEGRYAALLEIL